MGEIKIVLAAGFCVMFCYMFLDRYWFRGQLGELCFGRLRRTAAAVLRRVAGTLESPAGRSTPPDEEPAERAAIQESEDALIPQSRSTARQTPPSYANRRHGAPGQENTHSFEPGTPAQDKEAELLASFQSILWKNKAQEGAGDSELPPLFTDRSRVSFDTGTEQERKPRPVPPATEPPQAPATEEAEDGGAEQTASDMDDDPQQPGPPLDTLDSGQGIGVQELDWIIALCNGRPVPTDKRESIVKAIYAIRDTQIHKALLKGINDSDDRISRFLDEAERDVGDQ